MLSPLQSWKVLVKPVEQLFISQVVDLVEGSVGVTAVIQALVEAGRPTLLAFQTLVVVVVVVTVEPAVTVVPVLF
jgi:hypothetical protein